MQTQTVQTANLSQLETLESIHARLCNVKAKNATAKGKQLEFSLWYGNLEWYARSFEPQTLLTARRYALQIAEANKLGEEDAAFGIEHHDPAVTGAVFGTDYFGAENATIKRGSKGETVKRWQRLIGSEPDGDFGPTTDRLTREWQKKNGLKVDGIVGAQSWGLAIGNSVQASAPGNKTITPPAPATTTKEILAEQRNVVIAQDTGVSAKTLPLNTASGLPILRRGSKGPDVARWQRIIGADIDSDYGAQTEALTKAWQKRYNVPVDGVVDDLDWAASAAAPAKTSDADLRAAVPAIKKNLGELPSSITPATVVVKAKAKDSVKKVTEKVKESVTQTKVVLQGMPVWQRVLAGVAVVGCGIMGIQLLTGPKKPSNRLTAKTVPYPINTGSTTGPMSQFKS